MIFRKIRKKGTEFFVIVSGDAEVSVAQGPNPPLLFPLQKGNFFGEKAILEEAPRAATITARGATQLRCLALSKEAFGRLGLAEKLHFGQPP